MNNVTLCVGYAPDRQRYIEELAELESHPSDVHRYGPNMRIADVHNIEQLSGIGLMVRSSRRSLVLDLTGASTLVQTSLLKILEEVRPLNYFILTATDLSTVLPTIQSRALVKTFVNPSYGVALSDMTTRGLDFRTAALVAKSLSRGLALEQAPDQAAVAQANSLIVAARQGDVELAMRVAANASPLMVVALRLALLDTLDDCLSSALSVDRQLSDAHHVIGCLRLTYEYREPRDIANLVAISILAGG